MCLLRCRFPEGMPSPRHHSSHDLMVLSQQQGWVTQGSVQACLGLVLVLVSADPVLMALAQEKVWRLQVVTRNTAGPLSTRAVVQVMQHIKHSLTLHMLLKPTPHAHLWQRIPHPTTKLKLAAEAVYDAFHPRTRC